MFRRIALLALLSLGAIAANPPAWAQLAEPTAAQSLPTTKLTIITRDGKRHELNVEMALTPQQQEIGLMFRHEMAADHGMLFDWGAPREVPMWMKNTFISLDMLDMDDHGVITHITEDAVPQSLAEIPSGGPVRATLELVGGLAAQLDIRVGDRVENEIFKK